MTGSAWLRNVRVSFMGLFYFDIQIGDEPRSIDEEGEYFADLDMARAEAGLVLCGLGREFAKSGRTVSNITISVRDELGEVLQARIEFQMTRLN